MAESVKKPRIAKSKTTGSARPTPIRISEPTHEQIAELARNYWAQRGYTDGHHEEDWLRAEEQLRAKAS